VSEVKIMRSFFHTTLLALALAVSGCGAPARPRVEGKVTVGGKVPVDQFVTLYHEGQQGATFSQRYRIQPDGSFAGEAPAPGKYKVLLEPSLAAQEGLAKPASQVRVPAKYRDRTTSGLEWDVQPGENKRDFELPS
jgi:hypothetical protein